MPTATVLGPALVAAAMLVVAGAQKVLDPTMTVGALRALRLPSAPVLVRGAAAAELALGVLAVSAGGQLVWALVGLSYLAFSAVVIASMRTGSPVGTCGCFGREETPPHPIHLALNLVFALVATIAAVRGWGGVTQLPESVAARVGFSVMLVPCAVLVHVLYVEVPRLHSGMRSLRELDLSSLGRSHHRRPA